MPTGASTINCSGTEFYLLQDARGLPVEAYWKGPLLAYRRYTFTADTVQYDGRVLLSRVQWEAPLAAYLGVITARRKYGKHSYLHMAILKHGVQNSLDVTLYQALSPDGLRARQEECARLLDVPALTKTVDGFSKRAAGDLDKPLRQRVAEGSLAVAFDPAAGPPGRRLSLRIQGDTLVLRSRPSRAWALLDAPLILGGLAGVLAGHLGVRWVEDAPIGFYVVLLAVGGGLVVWHVLAREELHLSPREVRRRLLVARLKFSESALPSDKIEEVVVASPASASGFSRVQAIADSGTVSFGMMLSKPQRRWVRDCIIAVISK